MQTEPEDLPKFGEPEAPAGRSGSQAGPEAVATLVPTKAPGRLNRKVRQYRAQIVQLHAQGHTFAAIHEMLAEAGVVVSISTVRREALNTLPVVPWPPPAPGTAPVESRQITPSSTTRSKASPTTSSIPGDGVDYAATYAKRTNHNALSRAKEKS